MSKERIKLEDFGDYYTKRFRPGRIVFESEGLKRTILVQSGDRLFQVENQVADVPEATTVCHIESYGPLGYMGLELERFKERKSFLLGKLPDNKIVLLPLSEIG